MFGVKNKAKEKTHGYSAFQNMVYIMKGTFRWQKVLLPMLIIYAFTQTGVSFIWTVNTKIVIDQITSSNGIHSLIAVVLITTAIEVTLLLVNNYINSQTWWRFIYARMKFISLRVKKTITMDYQKLESPEMLDIAQKAANATGDNNNGVEGIMHSTMNSIVNFTKVFTSAAIICTLNPLLILIMLALSVLHFIVVDRTKKLDKKEVWDKLAPLWRKLGYMDTITRNFSFAKDIRIFSMKDWLIKKQKDINDGAHLKIVKSQNFWIKAGFKNQFIEIFQEGILYAWLVYSVLYNNLSIANFTLYLGTVRTFFATLGTILDSIADIRNQSEQINDFRRFVEYPDETSVEEQIPLPDFKEYNFVFENVSFKYPGQEKYALENLNIKIKSGQRIAVVGLNGAGKTTFIKLLCRLYEHTSGRILLNGQDIRKYNKMDYYTLFSPVFQNVEIFAFPIAENVSMKAPSDTDCERAEKCLKLAGLEDKIKTLTKGVNTQLLKVLYDDGIDLSGGEKQKLALARALYKDAAIIILDEPTAALDALAEYKLYMDFDKLIGKKTAVYISHRLSSTRFCDAVAMFENGKMVEYGTHEELLKKQGAYARMFEVQAQYYRDDEDMEENLNA